MQWTLVYYGEHLLIQVQVALIEIYCQAWFEYALFFYLTFLALSFMSSVFRIKNITRFAVSGSERISIA